MWVGRLLHCLRFRIVTILDHGHIPSQLFEQVNELGGFLLGQEVYLKVQMFPPFLKFSEPLLANQNYRRCQQCAKTNNPFEPEKRRRVKRRYPQLSCNDIREYPQRDEQNNAGKENWPSDNTAYGFNDPLRPSNFLVFTFIKRSN